MKKTLLFVALIAVGPVTVEAQQDLDELVKQGETYLKRGFIRRNNLRPYTGNVIQYAPSYCFGIDRLPDGGCREWNPPAKSIVVVRGRLRDGKWHGQYESYSTSSLVLEGMYNMGERCGEWREMTYRSVGEFGLGRTEVGLESKTYPAC